MTVGDKGSKTVQFYVCDHCNRFIIPPEGGLCVHGNIYVADPSARGGLVGNNIDADSVGRITEVRETVLCRSCFDKATWGVLARKTQQADERHPDEARLGQRFAAARRDFLEGLHMPKVGAMVDVSAEECMRALEDALLPPGGFPDATANAREAPTRGPATGAAGPGAARRRGRPARSVAELP